jgi:hypothetical protein
MFITLIARIVAHIVHWRTQRWATKPEATQQKVFEKLIFLAKNTDFGKAHNFADIHTYEDFKRQVAITDYEGLRPYIEQALAGKSDVLWAGKPLYFAKTSGTTSGAKYIPITKNSMPNHISGARNALLAYVYDTRKTDFLRGKMMFLSGSPVLETKNGVPIGRLSGIVNHHVPPYLRRNQVPSYTTNCIDDWEQKVDAIVAETHHQNLTLIGGIPPWVQMYFDRLMAMKNGEPIKNIFKNLSLFVYGGVNFEPYRQKMEQTIGKKIDSIELFPASEGFFAYQNQQNDSGLLLRLDSGIFYEFVQADTFFGNNPVRVRIDDVILHQNYVLILNTNAGLWGYNIGDTVKFVSKNPYKIRVTGRIKHFISAFGEHVIGEEVDRAMQSVSKKYGAEVVEFHVAPQVNPNTGLPYHEWFVEFGAEEPSDMAGFTLALDAAMCQQNIYYNDLIIGNILQPLKITVVPPQSFIDYMKKIGKLGGQNKLPRLADNRQIADALL